MVPYSPAARANGTVIRSHGWQFPTQVRSNRRVDISRTGSKPVSEQSYGPRTVVHVEGFEFVRAFRLVATNGDTEHWTNDLAMDEPVRHTYAQGAWAIELYHRSIKQCTEVERCPASLVR